MKKKFLYLIVFMIACNLNNMMLAQTFSKSFEKEATTPKGKSIIYIYRYNKKHDPFHFTIHVKQNPASDFLLYSKGYAVLYADPGKTEIWAQAGKKRYNIVVDAEEGKSYYIKTNLKKDIVIPIPRIFFILTPEEQALKEIKGCKLLE